MAEPTNSAGGGWRWGTFVLLAVLVLAKLGGGSSGLRPSPFPAPNPPPDFKVPDFARLDPQRAQTQPRALDADAPRDGRLPGSLAPAEEPPAFSLAVGTTQLSPTMENEVGVTAAVERASVGAPRLELRNSTQPPFFLGEVRVHLRCPGVEAQTLKAGHLRSGQVVALPWPTALDACREPPLFEARAKHRWRATAEAADQLAGQVLASPDRVPEGELEYFATQFTPRTGRTLVLLAARPSKDQELARDALGRTWPTARRFLLSALPALDDPDSPLSALVGLPERAAPVLALPQRLAGQGLYDAQVVAIERDRRLPKDAYLAQAQRPLLRDRVAAEERFGPDASEAIERRRRAAIEAVAAALANYADEESAGALLGALLRSREDQAAPLAAALARMPRTAAAVAAARLAVPAGEEAFFAYPLLSAALPDLDPALAFELGVPAARVAGEVRMRYERARAQQARLLWELSEEADLEGDAERALEKARAAVALGHPPGPATAALPRLALSAARARARGRDFAGALEAVSLAQRLGAAAGEADGLRAQFEAQVLESMFERGVARAGPGVEYAPVPLGVARAGEPVALDSGWILATLGTRVGFLPPNTRHGPQDRLEAAGVPVSQIRARLSRLEAEGIRPENAREVWLQAWYEELRDPVLWALGLALAFLLSALLVQPAAVGLRLFGMGQERLGLALGRWGFGRHPPLAALRYTRMLVRRAERVPGEARARLEAASHALEIYGADREGLALAGHIALLRGQRELSYGQHERYLQGSTLGWARRLAHFDLARIALHEDRLEAAATHGAKAGGASGALLRGAALLALEKPAAAPLLRAALDGGTRAAALSLLGHAFLGQDRLGLAAVATRLAPGREGRGLYARARLAQALGRVPEARSAYAELLRLAPGHSGARLGLALLERAARPAAIDDLSREESDAGGAARNLLAREELSRGEARRAAERLKLPRAGGASDLEVLGAAEAARGRLVEADAAFRQAAGRVGGAAATRLAMERSHRLGAKALAAGRAEDALRILRDDGPLGLLSEARSRVVASLLRKEPELGVSAAMERAVGAGVGLRDQAAVPMPIASAAQRLACGNFAAATQSLNDHLRDADDPAAWFVLGLARSCCEDGPLPERMGELARAAAKAPAFAPAAHALLATAELAAGREAQARAAIEGLGDRSQLSGPAVAHVEGLALRLGLAASGAVGRALEEARQGRAIEAGKALDALDGERSVALLRARAAVAASAARARVQVSDFAGAAAELEALYSPAWAGQDAGEGCRRARLAAEALPDALAELSLEAFPRLATRDPARALRLLERTRELPKELAPHAVHDRAVAALGACLKAGAAADEVLLQSLAAALDALLGDPEVLAVFRLRRLELSGDGPAPPADFGAEVTQKILHVAGGYLVWLLEQGAGAKVCAALEPWASKAGEAAGFGAALRRATDLVEVELRELNEALRAKLASLKTLEAASEEWASHEVRLGKLLDGLRHLRADTGLVSACEDSSARSLDAFSVHVFNGVAKGWLPLRIIERALAIARSEHLRRHLLENRTLMSG
ncbi:MAG TPA: hypothetical protein VGK67_24960 [Myxococcales bacterium]|jgi:hypothetical protein